MATVDTQRVLDLLNEAAEAAGAALGSVHLAAGVVGEGTQPDEFLPGPGCKAVKANMRGLDGVVVMFFSAELVDAVNRGPLGGQDFTIAAEPALRAAAMVLDQAAPKAIRLDPSAECDGEAMLASAGSSWFFAASPLFEGEEHRASVAVFLEDPEVVAARAATEEPDEVQYYAGAEPVGEVYSPPQTSAAYATAGGGGGAATMAIPATALRLLHDVEMDVTVELGRTRMAVRQILGLTPGSVIELDRAAGAPVDLLVNGTLIGRGEVVVIDEEFGVRISEIVGKSDDGA